MTGPQPDDMQLPPGLVLTITGRGFPRGRLLGGAPRVLVKVDEDGLRDLQAGSPAARHPELARLLLDAGLAVPQPAVTRRWGLADVTAVIPVKDDAVRLPHALAAVAGVAAVVVVDDGSTDGTGEVARAAGATVIRHETPRGPAAARNAGLALAQTPLVVMVDADASAEPGWIEELLGALADPAVLLAAPRVLGHDERGGSLIERYERVQNPLDQGPVPGLIGPGRDVGFVPAAALLVRREPLLRLGGFDAALQMGEDVDLCARASAAGWLLRYEPSVVVRHDHRTAFRSFVRRRFQYGTAGAQVHHPDLLAAISAGGWIAAAVFVVAAPRRGAVAASAAAAGVTGTRSAALLLAAGVPLRDAAATSLRAELVSARRFVGMSVRFSGLPVTSLLALRSRRARALLVAGSLGMHVRDHRRLQPEMGPFAFVGLRLLEESALGLGLLTVCVRMRSLRPLDPRLALLPRRGRDDQPSLTWQARASRAR